MIAVFGTAVGSTQNAQENLIARQKALEAMESIYTARNTQQITFAQIANIASGGIFTSGATQLLSAGPDGLVNTADDVAFPPPESARLDRSASLFPVLTAFWVRPTTRR